MKLIGEDLAALFKEFEQVMERRWNDPAWNARMDRMERAEAEEKRKLEFELDTSMAHKALRGEYGPESKLIAEKLTYGGTEMGVAVLVELRMALRKVRGRISA